MKIKYVEERTVIGGVSIYGLLTSRIYLQADTDSRRMDTTSIASECQIF